MGKQSKDRDFGFNEILKSRTVSPKPEPKEAPKPRAGNKTPSQSKPKPSKKKPRAKEFASYVKLDRAKPTTNVKIDNDICEFFLQLSLENGTGQYGRTINNVLREKINEILQNDE